MSRDARLVILARALRTFGYGCTSVLIAPMLVADGDSPAEIGVLLAVTAAGSVLASIALGMFADRLGRRTSLLLSAGTMAIAGIAFSWSESYPLLLAAGFVGTLSPSTNDNTPFSGVEQSVLAQTCPDDRHTAVFARYNMIALLAGALGGLAAAGLSTLTWVEPGDVAFGVYAGLAVISGIVFTEMSPAVEAQPRAEPAPELADTTPLHPVPRVGLRAGPAARLAGLFAVDAFAGGLAVQAILALWLQERYGVSTAALGVLFFVTNLLSALSQAVAPALARRRGLLQTMLVPHLVSNVLLLAVTVAPSFHVAALLLAARHALSKIDVPARQAFTAAVVSPQQRTAAASLTTVARSVATSASPLTSSLLLSAPLLACGAPLLAGGALALTYDVTMWCNFRSEPAGRERAAPAHPSPGRHRARRHRMHAGHAPGRGTPPGGRVVRNRTSPATVTDQRT
jgi:MFS family permease